MKFFSGVLLALLFSSASAQSLTDVVGVPEIMGLHTVSHHTPNRSANNVNPGVYIITDKGITVGTYFNSHRVESVYVGWTTPEWYRFRASFLAITGYLDKTNYIVIPSVRIYTFENGVNLRMVAGPNAYVEGQSIVHFMVDWKL